MRMTREEAICTLERLRHTESKWPDNEDTLDALDLALTALRGPTREMVKRMFRGCADCQRKTCVSCRRFGRVPERCIYCNNQDKWRPWNFCPVCGKPLTDEAVDMMLKRMEEIYKWGSC